MTCTRLIIGCGYLGRRVASRWLAAGDTVHALTRSSDRALEWRRAGLIPLIGDVTRPESLPELPQVDTLLFAVGFDRRSGQSQRDVYVGGLGHVLSRIAGTVRRILYVSSTSVYGQNAGEWVDESSECRPETDNGQVCLDAERLLREAVPTANILRLAGIYGPGRLVARIESLRARTPVEGNPDAWLNLIHVDDAVSALFACTRQGADGATYLISDNEPCRRRDYYSLLSALVGAPSPYPPIPEGKSYVMPEYAQPVQEASEGTNLNKRCCNRRLREALQLTLRFPSMRIGLPHALTTS